MWVRIRCVARLTLFAPSEQLQGGSLLSDLSGARATITLDDYRGVANQEDVRTSDGETSSACDEPWSNLFWKERLACPCGA